MGNEESVQNLNYWNGLVMLVSVGTLLYITMMHMLPEVYSNKQHSHHHHHEHNEESSRDSKESRVDQQESSRAVKLVTLLLGVNAAFLLTSLH